MHLGRCCHCGEDEDCYFGVIDGGTMETAITSNSPTAGFVFGVDETNLNAAVHGPSGTGRIKIFLVGMVEKACLGIFLPSGTAWIDACIDFLTAGGVILLVGEVTNTGCVTVPERTAINTFLSDIGSSMTMNTAGVSINTGDQRVTGPSGSARKVLQHPLTLNACNMGHGGAGQVSGGTVALQGILDVGGGGTAAAISSEDLYLDAMNPDVFGRVVFLCDLNFFNSAISNIQNRRFLDNMCGWVPCQVTRWTASSQDHSSTSIYNDGGSTSGLTWSYNDATITHTYGSTGKSAFAIALTSNSFRWDLNANGNGGIESFCVDFSLNMNIVTSTYVNGSGQFIAPKIGLCVLHDSGYYTTLDTLALTETPTPTSSSAARSYSIGPVTPADFALITGWPGGGAAPAIGASGAVGVRYVRFGLAFEFEDATNGTVTRFSIASETLKLDCNCA